MFASPTIHIVLLELFILLKKKSRLALCLKSPTDCLYCALITTFLLILFIISMANDTMSLLFVPQSDLSLNVKIVNKDTYTTPSAMFPNLVYRGAFL